MIYGFCVELLKNSKQFNDIREHNATMPEKEVCIHALKLIGLKYNLRIMYDVNVRVDNESKSYYNTDMYFTTDTPTVDVDDKLIMFTLNKGDLDDLQKQAYPIMGCGWKTLYSNEKDYNDLTKAEIENCMRGGAKCLGD